MVILAFHFVLDDPGGRRGNFIRYFLLFHSYHGMHADNKAEAIVSVKGIAGLYRVYVAGFNIQYLKVGN